MKKYFILVLSLCMVFGLSACSDAETDKAKANFEKTAKIVEKNNKTIKKDIKALKKLTKSKTKPLDENVSIIAKQTITYAKEEIVKVPECPSNKDEIKKANKKLKKKSDKSEIIQSLESSTQAMKDSIAQRKQVTNPSEAFVLDRLNGIPNVSGQLAVNEETDINGLLHKAGGYTAAIYFTSDLVDATGNGLKDGDALAKGNDGGGCIEVFETEEEAEKRNIYLSAFDGTVLRPGSHKVVGTVIIRTSDYLTATQQNDMTTNIYNSLIALR